MTTPSSRRAELKRAYREKPPPAGVFAVRNLETGRLLVGASMNVQGSLNGIRFQLQQRVYRTHPELQADANALGLERFSFEVLDVLEPSKNPDADPREELRVLEALWMERLKPFGAAGYNASPAP